MWRIVSAIPAPAGRRILHLGLYLVMTDEESPGSSDLLQYTFTTCSFVSGAEKLRSNLRGEN
jgi:hypothetical protein